MASTNSKTQNFRNMRYAISADVVLSISGWECDGYTTQALALFVGGELQHETAIEIRHKKEPVAFYMASCRATEMVRAEYVKLGQEMPLRFFRDNGI